MDKLKGMRKNAKEIALISAAVLVTGIVILATRLNSHHKTAEVLSPEIAKSREYTHVQAGDNVTNVANVKFDAFFLRDTDGDGYAESIRGACRKVGEQDTLYMELNVESEGELRNAQIQIQGKNFYLSTTLPKDQQLKSNYISSNTKTIQFNTISSGTQRILMGKVRSGDYTSSSKNAAIGNDTNNYSVDDNKIILTGTYVNDGIATQIRKEVELAVDWYGEANASISTTNISRSVTDFNSLYDDTNLNLSFTAQTAETTNTLILKKNVLTGTIPALNGYMPTAVTITGTNVTYTYNQETGAFTAERNAVINGSGVVTTNAYTSQSGNTRYNSYTINISYPKEAYEAESNQNVTLNIPMQTYYEGYNNPDEDFGNPYTSNTASSTVVATWYQYVAPSPVTYTYSSSVDVQIGKYVGSPYSRYYISKEKPARIYNGVSETETEDYYTVSWYAFTGTDTNYSGLTLKENVNNSTSTIDTFVKSDSTEASMDGIASNVGIYYSNPTSLLGSEGWIKVYNDETDELLVTFDSSNWNEYSSSNPYMYTTPVKHVRVETSSTNNVAGIYIYHIKELNDTAITTQYAEEQFDTLKQIKTNLRVYFGENATPSTDTAIAYYEEPYSVATFAIAQNQLSTQETYENEVITITTRASNFMEQKWKNGTFIVKMPSDIMDMSINNISVSDNSVTIAEKNLYEDNGNYYLRIETTNSTPAAYTITIDCNLTPNPRMATATETIEMYAKNEDGVQYYYGAQDACDVDANGDATESVHKSTLSVSLIAPSTLLTHQTATNFDYNESVAIAPQVAKVEKSQRTANVELTVANNYSNTITNVQIQGVIPFTGNKNVIGNRDLGSSFTTTMSNTGVVVPATLSSYATVYYSTLERPTKDINDNTNGWVTAENVSDWSQIKTFMIDLGNYELGIGASHTFSYEINLPAGLNYNDISYSGHAVYFDLVTDAGLYSTSTEVSKLGFMVVRQYDLILEEYQKDTSKKLSGAAFKITQIGNESQTVKKSTDANGTLTVSGLYAEKRYKLQQTRISDDYVLNSEEIEFYTYVDGNDNLVVTYYNTSSSSYQALTEKYSWVKSATTPAKEEGENYKAVIALENEVKAKVRITKTYTNTDSSTGNLRGAKFVLTGQGRTSTLMTNTSGNAISSGLLLGQTYTLTETKAKGYYLNDAITFSVSSTGSGYTHTLSGNATATVTTEDEIPIINITIDDEQIPTYSLKVTTYQKDQASTKLAGAQYRLTGDGLADDGVILTADSNGEINIDGLYEYVDASGSPKGGYTGQYTITQIYAPEGYALNNASVTFKAARNAGSLEVTPISGVSSESPVDPINVTDPATTNPIVTFGFKNEPIFKLKKYDEYGNPLAGAKFTITIVDENLNGSTPAQDSSGNIIGELDANSRYVVTTNENGEISLDLPQNYYKVVEVEAPEGFVLAENEADRTQYFGVAQSKPAVVEFGVAVKTAVKGTGFNTINSVKATADGGFVAVGSLYGSADIEGTTYTSQGRKDGLIIKYDSNNEVQWVRNIGGTLGEEFKKVIQTSDKGYAVVGYFESETLNIDNTIKNSGARDGILIKLDQSGTYSWSAVIGGTPDTTANTTNNIGALEDYAFSLCEDGNGNILVTGGYFSEKLGFTGTTSATGTLTNLADMDGYVASFSSSGAFNWAQNLGSTNATSGVQAVDVAVVDNKYAVAVNFWGALFVDSEQTTSITNAGNQDSAVVFYDTNGAYQKYINVSGAGYDDIRGIVLDNESNMVVYGNRTNATTISYSDSATTASVAAVGGTTYLSSYIFEFGSTGNYLDTKTITFGNSSGNDELMEIVPTEDNGLLIGGFTYNTTLDINADGTNDLTATGANGNLSGTANSRGYIAKIKEDKTVSAVYKQYNNNYYQETRSVAETEDGGMVAGGVVDGAILNLDIANETITEGLDVYSQDGYIVKYGEKVKEAGIPKKAEVEFTNNLETYSITLTQYSVENGEEEGDRLYDVGATTTGNYTADYKQSGHKKLVETVKYQEDGEQAITITPETDYSIVGITVDGDEYEYTVSEVDGSVTIPAFENVTKDKIVIVKVNKNMAEVKVNHYLWTEAGGATTTKVADSESIYGKVGSDYHTSPKLDINYNIITNADYYAGQTESDVKTTLQITEWSELGYEDFEDFKANYYIPTNANKTYTAEGIIVNYYYKEIKYTLTVKHLMAGTETPVTNKDTAEGVADQVTENLSEGAAYNASPSENVDYNTYEVTAVSKSDENAVVNEETNQVTGTISSNTTITYYYEIKDGAAITVHYYIAGTTTRVPSSTGEEVSDATITTVTEQGVERTAKIGDPYTTVAASNVAANYQLDSTPANSTGTFTSAAQEVNYYYSMVTPTISNTSTTVTVNKATMADSAADQSLTYTITYNATVQNYKGNVTATIVDTLPFKIDTTQAYSLNGGVYDDANKTITWRQAIPVDTYADASSGTISVTKTITLTYKDIPVTTGNLANTVEGSITAVETNTTSETTTQTAQTTYTHYRDITVTNVWSDDNDSKGTRPSSITVNLVGTVTNPDSSTLTVNLTSLDANITTSATLSNSTGSENGANWTYTWSQLPKYDAVGRLITYTVDAASTMDLQVYTPEVSGNMNDGYTITVYYTYSGTTERQTATQWFDAEDGKTESRPKAIGSDVSFTTQANGYTRRGFTFRNWRFESPTGEDVAAETTFTFKPDVDSTQTTYNMYAIWDQN